MCLGYEYIGYDYIGLTYDYIQNTCLESRKCDLHNPMFVLVNFTSRSSCIFLQNLQCQVSSVRNEGRLTGSVKPTKDHTTYLLRTKTH